MSRKNKNKNYPKPLESTKSLGGVLKAARMKMNLSIEEIHHKTKIPAASITLMESDSWSQLPAPVYVRGFIKLFAREVALDYTEIIELYPHNEAKIPSLAKTSTLPLLTSMDSLNNKEKEDERESRVSTALVVFILLILATLAISYFSSQKENSSSNSPSASEMANFDVTG